MNSVTIRFYAELNELLPPNKRHGEIQVPFKDSRSVKDLIESLGIPHTEVDLILANGKSVDFSYPVREGDRFSVYPVFESLNVRNATRLRQLPLRHTRFIADNNLGGIVRLMRMLGFDVYFDPAFTPGDIIDVSGRQNRIILTCSRKLLKFRDVTHGLLIRPAPGLEQVRYILERLDIRDQAKPFSRCFRCNGILLRAKKEDVLDRIPLQTRGFCDTYFECEFCGKLYWNGTHRIRMGKTVDFLLERL
jgi:uncharacterized protein with PIN domain